MDLIYAASLILALVAGSAGIVLGLLAMRAHTRRPWHVRAGWAALAVAAMSLATSVTVHWRWGHSPATVAPQDFARLVDAHEAFPVSAFLIAVGAVVVLAAMRRPPGA